MILEDLLVYESYINGKITKRIRAKGCLELVHIDMYEPFCVYAWIMFVFHHFIDKYSGLDMYIGNLIPWIHSLNLRQGLDNLLGKISRTSIKSKW